MDIEKKREYDRNWKRKQREKNPERVRAVARAKYKRLRENPEWVKKHREYMNAYLRTWRKDNPAYLLKLREAAKIRHRKNAKRIYELRRARPYEKLAATMRSRIHDLLKNGYKSAKTEKLLGVTMKELKVYLEKQFTEGMTWENYGFYGWHCDHVRPLASFDLTQPEEQKKAFHYTNLQPLWAKDNLHKHAKIS